MTAFFIYMYMYMALRKADFGQEHSSIAWLLALPLTIFSRSLKTNEDRKTCADLTPVDSNPHLPNKQAGNCP